MKYLHGKPVSNNEFKDAVIDAVAARDVARPAQLFDDLGIVDSKHKQSLSVLMVDLTNQGLLIREGRGQYSVSKSYERRRNRAIDSSIAAVIAQYGGLARRSEILKAFDALPSMNKHLLYGGRSATLTRYLSRKMVDSTLFHRINVGANADYWRLAESDFLNVPVSGRAVETLAKHQWLDATESGGRNDKQSEAELMEDIETHFVRVGMALRRVRRLFGLNLDGIAKSTAVDNCVEWARWRSPEFSQEVRTEIRLEAKSRAAAEQVEIGSDRYDTILEEEEMRFGVFALDRLEGGSAAAHRAMPVAIFYEYAEAFDVCPASLSRGIVQFAKLNERHKALKAGRGWLP